MSITSFFKLVEIQTKVASVIPYLIGTLFAWYKFERFHIQEAILFFLGMLIFDMTTTAINNYVDYTKAIKKEGFGYEEHNAITKYNLNPKVVLSVIIGMLVIASGLGILLVLKTDWVVLVVGAVCFIVGILYSFGPIPISRTPFGEVFSGITMGFFITFLAVYIHIYDQEVIDILFTKTGIHLFLDFKLLINVVMCSIPVIIGIANIMLANNICDIEDDIVNKRYTLPVYIGKEASLQIFKYSYYLAFICIIIGVIVGILPVISLITLITLKPIRDNIKAFIVLQSKKDTFVLAVKNFVMMNVVYMLTIGIASVLQLL